MEDAQVGVTQNVHNSVLENRGLQKRCYSIILCRKVAKTGISGCIRISPKSGDIQNHDIVKLACSCLGWGCQEKLTQNLDHEPHT